MAFCNERKINQGGGVRWRNLGRPTQRAVLLAERHRRCSGQIQIPCPPPTVSNAKRPKNKRGLSLPAASHSDRVSTISGVRRPCVPCSDSAYCGRFNFDLGASTFIVEEKKGIECVFGRVEGENQGFLLLLFFCDEIARSLLRIAMTDDDSRGR